MNKYDLLDCHPGDTVVDNDGKEYEVERVRPSASEAALRDVIVTVKSGKILKSSDIAKYIRKK